MYKSKLNLMLRSAGLTQAEFADAMGMSLSALCNRLTGARPWTVAQMVRGAEVLRLSVWEAMELFGPPLSKRQEATLRKDQNGGGQHAGMQPSAAPTRQARDAGGPVENARAGRCDDGPCVGFGNGGGRRFRLGGAVR